MPVSPKVEGSLVILGLGYVLKHTVEFSVSSSQKGLNFKGESWDNALLKFPRSAGPKPKSPWPGRLPLGVTAALLVPIILAWHWLPVPMSLHHPGCCVLFVLSQGLGMQSRLALNCRSFCLSLLNDGVRHVPTHLDCPGFGVRSSHPPCSWP